MPNERGIEYHNCTQRHSKDDEYTGLPLRLVSTTLKLESDIGPNSKNLGTLKMMDAKVIIIMAAHILCRLRMDLACSGLQIATYLSTDMTTVNHTEVSIALKAMTDVDCPIL